MYMHCPQQQNIHQEALALSYTLMKLYTHEA
jgi:hypothetical protein